MKLETSERASLTAALQSLEVARHELAGLPSFLADGDASEAHNSVLHARRLVADILTEDRKAS